MQIAAVVVSFHQFIRTDVPHHHRAAAVLSFWNNAFEIEISERMIFGRHGKTFFGSLIRRSLGNSPGLQRVVHFKPEVIVKVTGIVLLNDETPCASLPASADRGRSGLLRFAEV